MIRQQPLYDIDNSVYPPSCLPSSLTKSRLLDITTVGDAWRKYLDPATGRVHDGAEYFKKALAVQEDRSAR